MFFLCCYCCCFCYCHLLLILTNVCYKFVLCPNLVQLRDIFLNKNSTSLYKSVHIYYMCVCICMYTQLSCWSTFFRHTNYNNKIINAKITFVSFVIKIRFIFFSFSFLFLKALFLFLVSFCFFFLDFWFFVCKTKLFNRLSIFHTFLMCVHVYICVYGCVCLWKYADDSLNNNGLFDFWSICHCVSVDKYNQVYVCVFMYAEAWQEREFNGSFVNSVRIRGNYLNLINDRDAKNGNNTIKYWTIAYETK